MKAWVGGVALAVALGSAAWAQETKVTIGISGWTGFAPLTLAKEAGIFKKNGVDVTIKKVPQASRHLAIQSGDIAPSIVCVTVPREASTRYLP